MNLRFEDFAEDVITTARFAYPYQILFRVKPEKISMSSRFCIFSQACSYFLLLSFFSARLQRLYEKVPRQFFPSFSSFFFSEITMRIIYVWWLFVSLYVWSAKVVNCMLRILLQSYVDGVCDCGTNRYVKLPSLLSESMLESQPRVRVFLIIKRHAILFQSPSLVIPEWKCFNVGFTTSDVIYKNTPFCTNDRLFV